ncbi:MAG: GNAT family N-acetyltransferase [Myxococcales bacterium]|nr:GNAT family N-acetyltransferase [Myxococcales bacterium]
MPYAAVPLDRDTQKDLLTSLWAENLSDPKMGVAKDRRFTWLYGENPAGPSRTFLVDDEGKDGIIGCASAYPRELRVGRHELRAGVLSDFAVKRAHRAAGAAVVVQRMIASTAEASGTSLLFGYPNKASSPIFKRLGYKVVAEATDHLKPLRAGAYLERVIVPQLEKRAPALAPWVQENAMDTLTALGGLVADVGMGLAERVARYGLGFDLVFEDLGRVDPRFDGLWARGKGQTAIELPRTAAYLNWRYADFTTTKYRFFSAASRTTGEVRGYLVYTLTDGWVSVADLFVDDANVVLDPLLAAFASAMRGEGHKAICIGHVGRDDLAKRLKLHGFFPQPNGRFLMVQVVKGAPEELSALAYEPSSWSVFDGDLDI